MVRFVDIKGHRINLELVCDYRGSGNRIFFGFGGKKYEQVMCTDMQETNSILEYLDDICDCESMKSDTIIIGDDIVDENPFNRNISLNE